MSKLANDTRMNQHLVVMGYNHISVIQKILSPYFRLSNWNVFMFYPDRRIDIEKVISNDLKLFFPDSDLIESHFYGYMYLK